jgi:hypothetical protein
MEEACGPTEQRKYTISLESPENARCYDAMLQACPGSWGVPFGGEIAPPHEDTEASRASLESLRRFYHVSAAKSLVVTLGLLGAGGLFGLTLFLVGADKDVGGTVVFVIVLVVAGLLFVPYSYRQLRVLMKLSAMSRSEPVQSA